MVRVNRIENHFLFAIEHIVAQAFRATGFGLQRGELMQNFLLGQFQRTSQARIQLSQGFAIPRQQFLQRFSVLLKFFGQRRRQEFLFHPPPQVLSSAQYIAETQLEFLQHPVHRRLNYRKTGPRQNCRHPSQQFLVDHFGLRHIRNFRRPAHVRRRRQQSILHDRPQQHARSKRIRRRLNRGPQFLRRERGLPRLKFSGARPQRLTHSVHVVKQQRRFRGHFHLRVKPAILQFLRSRRQRFAQRIRFVQRPSVHRRRQLMQLHVQRIDKNNPTPFQQPRQQFSKRRSVRFSGRVRFPQRRRHFLRVRSFEFPARLRYQRRDAFAQQNLADPPPFARVRRR